jgi:putative membrane protein
MVLIRFVISWLLLAAAFFGVAKVLPRFRIGSFRTALVASAVYSVLYIVLYAIFNVLWLLTTPLVILTLGLIYFVINAVILWLTDRLVDDFEVENTATLLVAAVLLTIANSIIRFIVAV